MRYLFNICFGSFLKLPFFMVEALFKLWFVEVTCGFQTDAGYFGTSAKSNICTFVSVNF